MAFWKKIFKSKYTGREIDAAVAKAGTVPTVTEADAGKALVVDEEGKIVAGSVKNNGYEQAPGEYDKLTLSLNALAIASLISTGSQSDVELTCADFAEYSQMMLLGYIPSFIDVTTPMGVMRFSLAGSSSANPSVIYNAIANPGSGYYMFSASNFHVNLGESTIKCDLSANAL